VRRIGLQLEQERIAVVDQHAGAAGRRIYGNGFLWIAGRRDVFYDETGKPPPKCDHNFSTCHRCGERKPRKGGSNVAHRFICAGCQQ
jgi:hypothetical protein